MIHLVLGGAASGKSRFAEDLVVAALAAGAPAPAVYVATAVAVGGDDDMAARIARHRGRRDHRWTTVEAGAGLAPALAAVDPSGVALVDALGTWVAAHPDLDADVDPLLEVLAARQGLTVVVSDEVGLGVHPESEVGRRFRDVLGAVNQAVAASADAVTLVVAGQPLVVKGVVEG